MVWGLVCTTLDAYIHDRGSIIQKATARVAATRGKIANICCPTLDDTLLFFFQNQ